MASYCTDIADVYSTFTIIATVVGRGSIPKPVASSA